MKALWRKGGASFWAAGCGVIRAQGLAPHGLRVLEAARAPQGGVPSASGWVGPLDALQALDTTPGPVSLGCLHGIATVLLRYFPGVAPMLMPSTWEQHRGDTGEIPCLHRAGWLGGMLGAARGFYPEAGACVLPDARPLRLPPPGIAGNGYPMSFINRRTFVHRSLGTAAVVIAAPRALCA